MDSQRFRFRLSDLFIVVTFVAIVTATATFLPSLYYTDGDIGLGFGRIFFGLCVFGAAVCLCFRRLRVATLVFTLFVCGLFIYHQTTLIDRQNQLEVEVARIVDYLNAFKTAHNEFPRDLSGYEFQKPELQPYIDYAPPGQSWGSSSYHINYHPTGTYQGIGHWYFGDRGHWFEDD